MLYYLDGQGDEVWDSFSVELYRWRGWEGISPRPSWRIPVCAIFLSTCFLSWWSHLYRISLVSLQTAVCKSATQKVKFYRSVFTCIQCNFNKVLISQRKGCKQFWFIKNIIDYTCTFKLIPKYTLIIIHFRDIRGIALTLL